MEPLSSLLIGLYLFRSTTLGLIVALIADNNIDQRAAIALLLVGSLVCLRRHIVVLAQHRATERAADEIAKLIGCAKEAASSVLDRAA